MSTSTPRRALSFERFVARLLLILIFGVEANVGTAYAAILELRDASNFGLEGFPDLVEKSFQGAVIRGFVNCSTG